MNELQPVSAATGRLAALNERHRLAGGVSLAHFPNTADRRAAQPLLLDFLRQCKDPDPDRRLYTGRSSVPGAFNYQLLNLRERHVNDCTVAGYGNLLVTTCSEYPKIAERLMREQLGHLRALERGSDQR